MVTYEFYRVTYGGKADEAAFTRAASAAETVLCRLLFPNIPDELTDAQRDAFSRAVCVQADAMQGGGDTPRVRSESLGDRSVTYTEDVRPSVAGIPVAAEAVLLLENSGCLCRWV